jgi:hypothetical protein
MLANIKVSLLCNDINSYQLHTIRYKIYNSIKPIANHNIQLYNIQKKAKWN